MSQILLFSTRMQAALLAPLFTPCAPVSTLSIATFSQQIRHEFIVGSAIAPALYEASVRIVRDLEVGPGGEVSTPIHDALGWHYARFGYRSQPNFYCALFENEAGSTWQAKLSTPRTDANGKIQKYESPKGEGSQAFLPPIPQTIRQCIAQRYGVTIPEEGSFWRWYSTPASVSIPLIVTEGGKKALALLSQGYVAIALYGVNGGYRTIGGGRSLIADLQPFVGPGRAITLAFDQDETAKTRRHVAIALLRLGSILTAAGAQVRVAQWSNRWGKGVDDLIVQVGPEAWNCAYRDALILEHWQLWQRLDQRLTAPVNLHLSSADLS
ncbi:MAG TPA: DUF3854 domain-containing protein, partial [Chroococcidiopsis sp.]